MNEPEILIEKADFLIINKPAGLVVHSDGRTKEATLCDWLVEKYPNIRGVGEPLTLSDGREIDRPGIVHRLDRETTGAMVVALTQEMFGHLKKQFQNHEVKKIYHAFVYGSVKEERGVIDRPIGKSKSDFRQWSAQRGARGEMRPAVTNFKVLERGEAEVPEGSKDRTTHGCERYTFIEAEPKTGRTHQIRVHMKAINHPLVADSLYAQGKPAILGFTRTALHARSLSFTDLSGERISAEAPYPDDFVEALL